MPATWRLWPPPTCGCSTSTRTTWGRYCPALVAPCRRPRPASSRTWRSRRRGRRWATRTTSSWPPRCSRRRRCPSCSPRSSSTWPSPSGTAWRRTSEGMPPHGSSGASSRPRAPRAAPRGSAPACCTAWRGGPSRRASPRRTWRPSRAARPTRGPRWTPGPRCRACGRCSRSWNSAAEIARAPQSCGRQLRRWRGLCAASWRPGPRAPKRCGFEPWRRALPTPWRSRRSWERMAARRRCSPKP
mmetsp:Transcript_19855/g.56051  ORF Transcript_19855/g.56051 Transcript_19855/m.56051 type:complete len:243 (+) Transcript_19855:195-923(+)